MQGGEVFSHFDASLKKALVISLILHLVLIVAGMLLSLFYVPRLRVPNKPYEVSLISLPGKPNLGQTGASPATPSLPKATIQEMKELTITTEQPKPMVVPTQPTKKVDPKDLAKEVARIKKELQKERTEEARLEDKIAAIAAAQARHVSTQKGKGEGTGEAGDKAGAGGSGTAEGAPGTGTLGVTHGLEQARYEDIVRALVLEAWHLPKWTVDSLPPDTIAILTVYVNEKGEVLRTQIEKSSNIAFYDESVVRAIRRISPFPEPPPTLVEEARVKGIMMRFSPRKSENGVMR